MKIIYFVLAMLMSSALGAQSADDILGKWQSDDGERIMEIYSENNLYWGKVVSTKKGDAKPGTIILKGFQFEATKWTGKVSPPNGNQEFTGTIQLSHDNIQMELQIAIAFMTRTKKWKRINK